MEEDGSITNVKIILGLGYGCDEEVLRLFKNSPKWTPAKRNGKPQRVRMSYPFKFQLGPK